LSQRHQRTIPEIIEPMIRVFFVGLPISPDEYLNFSKEFLLKIRMFEAEKEL
jgi:hypothetical protein